MTRIATWNINSIKARASAVARWLKDKKPHVLLLQEIKCTDGDFPRMQFEKLGYSVETVGQKAYNGVAILSQLPLSVVRRRLPGDRDDHQARYLEVVVVRRDTKKRGQEILRVASLYLPNGNPAGSESFAYKLAWLSRLVRHARDLANKDEAIVLGGDFNVAPTDADVYDAFLWGNDALCRPETRAKFSELLKLDFTDAIAARHPEPGNYTFWDYQNRAWAKNHGWRIDHLLLSPRAFEQLETCDIDKRVRGEEKASDHVPVWCDLKI